jgi:hypothetical protein
LVIETKIKELKKKKKYEWSNFETFVAIGYEIVKLFKGIEANPISTLLPSLLSCKHQFV